MTTDIALRILGTAFLTLTALTSRGEIITTDSPVHHEPPYELPFEESFADCETATEWNTYSIGEAEWTVTPYSPMPMTYSYDNDGGMLAFMAETPEARAIIESGEINIGSGRNPNLTFWTFSHGTQVVSGDITVSVDDGSGFQPLRVIPVTTGRPEGWYRVQLPMSQYSGKTVRLRFTGWCENPDMAQLVDCIRVFDIGNDMGVTRIKAPDKVNPGIEFAVEVTVVNNTDHAVDEYELRLYRDGAEVSAIPGTSASAGEYITYTIPQIADANWNNRVLYRAEVTAPGDNFADNNSSDVIGVLIDQNTFPTASDIKVYWTDDTRTDVMLEWDAPNFQLDSPVEYTEGFEYFPPFEPDPDMPGWTFIDYDGAETYGIEDYDFDWAGTRMAFMAIDSERFTGTIKARNGNMFLLSMDAATRQTDDWMFSPELSGKSQVITFWARSLSSTYGRETIQVLTSVGGIEMHEFDLSRHIGNIPATWTKYTCVLPAGTKHFAIRNFSQDVHGLLLDDITFIPARHPAENYALIGYNIYRDGQRLTPEPVTELWFHDTDPPQIGHSSYAVSVVYDRGESPASAYIEPTADLDEARDTETVRICGMTGAIELYTPVRTDFNIHGIDGRTIFAGPVTGQTEIAATPGIYVVSTRGFTRKVAVR